jgi:hypothetical protein
LQEELRLAVEPKTHVEKTCPVPALFYRLNRRTATQPAQTITISNDNDSYSGRMIPALVLWVIIAKGAIGITVLKVLFIMWFFFLFTAYN